VRHPRLIPASLTSRRTLFCIGLQLAAVNPDPDVVDGPDWLAPDLFPFLLRLCMLRGVTNPFSSHASPPIMTCIRKCMKTGRAAAKYGSGFHQQLVIELQQLSKTVGTLEHVRCGVNMRASLETLRATLPYRAQVL
jgi:hypothetical protein